jgi:hypothetical protein
MSPDADGEAIDRTIDAFEEHLAKEERESNTGSAGPEPPELWWWRRQRIRERERCETSCGFLRVLADLRSRPRVWLAG